MTLPAARQRADRAGADPALADRPVGAFAGAPATDRDTRFWDRIAERYAARPVADTDAYEQKLAITREYLHPAADVLEIGCGTGSTAIAHAPFVRHVRATDVSARMIAIARDKAVTAGIDNVDFVRADAGDRAAPDASVDVVLALNVLHLLDDWRGVLAASRRVLKPGGVLVSSTMCMRDEFAFMRPLVPLGRLVGLLPRVAFFGRDELERGMNEAGFTIERAWQPRVRSALFVVARADRRPC